MGISTSLSTALSGLNVASRMAEVTSNNIANTLTEGYARRSLAIGSTWGGVPSFGVQRHVSPGLTADRRLADAQLSADQGRMAMLTRVEDIIGAAGSTDSIAGRLAAFESALISASGEPSSDLRLMQLNGTLSELADEINSASSEIQALRQNADASIAQDVARLNAGLGMIAQLNADITRVQTAGQDASNLIDARGQAMDGISDIVPLRILQRGGDQIALMSTSGMILLDGVPSEFEFQPANVIAADMTLASGGLSGITRDGMPVDPGDGIGRLMGGSLGAAMAARDDELPTVQDQLDAFALNLMQRFEDPSVDPTTAGLGLLTDAGNPSDPSDFVGLAGRLRLNASVDPVQGGDLWRWRDGLGAAAAGPIGNANQLNRWQEGLSMATALPGGGTPRSSAGHIASLMAERGTLRTIAEQDLSFARARMDGLEQAELAHGVDSDQELQRLLQIEQAYAANARVIQTINSMMQQLMEI